MGVGGASGLHRASLCLQKLVQSLLPWWEGLGIHRGSWVARGPDTGLAVPFTPPHSFLPTQARQGRRGTVLHRGHITRLPEGRTHGADWGLVQVTAIPHCLPSHPHSSSLPLVGAGTVLPDLG